MSDRDPLADVLYQSETSSAYRLDEASDYTQCLYRDLARVAREHIAAEIEAVTLSGEHSGAAAYGNECRWEAGMERAARIARNAKKAPPVAPEGG